jgi:hypothetical protein
MVCAITSKAEPFSAFALTLVQQKSAKNDRSFRYGICQSATLASFWFGRLVNEVD